MRTLEAALWLAVARWGLTSAGFRRAEQDHYARLMQLFARAAGPMYNVYIRGTNHLTFSDFPLIVRLPDRTLMPPRGHTGSSTTTRSRSSSGT